MVCAINVSQEGPLEPSGRKCFCQCTAHNILINENAEGMRDLLGDAHAAKQGIAALELDDGGNELGRRTFRAGIAFATERG